MKPKVAHVSTVDLSLRYLLLNQMRAIQAAGYDVTGISAPGPNVAVVEEAGIPHIQVQMTRRFTPLKDLVSLLRLVRVLRRERFTIVHTHTPKPGLIGQLAARIAGVPIVINTLHGFYFSEHTPAHWRRFYITMEKIAARCSDMILSQNPEDIRTAIRERICPPERIKLLGNGIDVERFDPRCIDMEDLARTRREIGLPEEGLVVGFVGRLVTEKGVRELLQAARVVLRRFPQTRFLFVGHVDHEKPDAVTPEVAEEYGVGAACVFAGVRQDMAMMYALMDVFVLPSHREGFPRSPMEASAMGVPCIVTDIRGCRETVIPEQNGLLVPVRDVEALAKALLDLLSDRDRRMQMGMRGRSLALERFDEREVFSRVVAEYTRLLSEKRLTVKGGGLVE